NHTRHQPHTSGARSNTSHHTYASPTSQIRRSRDHHPFSDPSQPPPLNLRSVATPTPPHHLHLISVAITTTKEKFNPSGAVETSCDTLTHQPRSHEPNNNT
ncbi:hypothetical protein A2U01_0070214, partial [Trifolium medium]|nr:hypothetical protein [Trifolium medium]